MHIDPRIGILHILVIGRPSATRSARMFQFRHLLGMRSYTRSQRLVAGRLLADLLGTTQLCALRRFTSSASWPVLDERALGQGHCSATIISRRC